MSKLKKNKSGGNLESIKIKLKTLKNNCKYQKLLSDNSANNNKVFKLYNIIKSLLNNDKLNKDEKLNLNDLDDIKDNIFQNLSKKQIISLLNKIEKIIKYNEITGGVGADGADDDDDFNSETDSDSDAATADAATWVGRMRRSAATWVGRVRRSVAPAAYKKARVEAVKAASTTADAKLKSTKKILENINLSTSRDNIYRQEVYNIADYIYKTYHEVAAAIKVAAATAATAAKVATDDPDDTSVTKVDAIANAVNTVVAADAAFAAAFAAVFPAVAPNAKAKAKTKADSNFLKADTALKTALSALGALAPTPHSPASASATPPAAPSPAAALAAAADKYKARVKALKALKAVKAVKAASASDPPTSHSRTLASTTPPAAAAPAASAASADGSTVPDPAPAPAPPSPHPSSLLPPPPLPSSSLLPPPAPAPAPPSPHPPPPATATTTGDISSSNINYRELALKMLYLYIDAIKLIDKYDKDIYNKLKNNIKNKIDGEKYTKISLSDSNIQIDEDQKIKWKFLGAYFLFLTKIAGDTELSSDIEAVLKKHSIDEKDIKEIKKYNGNFIEEVLTDNFKKVTIQKNSDDKLIKQVSDAVIASEYAFFYAVKTINKSIKEKERLYKRYKTIHYTLVKSKLAEEAVVESEEAYLKAINAKKYTYMSEDEKKNIIKTYNTAHDNAVNKVIAVEKQPISDIATTYSKTDEEISKRIESLQNEEKIASDAVIESEHAFFRVVKAIDKSTKENERLYEKLYESYKTTHYNLVKSKLSEEAVLESEEAYLRAINARKDENIVQDEKYKIYKIYYTAHDNAVNKVVGKQSTTYSKSDNEISKRIERLQKQEINTALAAEAKAKVPAAAPIESGIKSAKAKKALAEANKELKALNIQQEDYKLFYEEIKKELKLQEKINIEGAYNNSAALKNAQQKEANAKILLDNKTKEFREATTNIESLKEKLKLAKKLNPSMIATFTNFIKKNANV